MDPSWKFEYKSLNQAKLALIDFNSGYWGFPVADSMLNKELKAERAKLLGLPPVAAAAAADAMTQPKKTKSLAERRAAMDLQVPIITPPVSIPFQL